MFYVDDLKDLLPKKKILTNPSLKMITDSTNEEFVKMCGLSLEEYYIFSDIMRKLDKEDEYDDDLYL